MNLQPSLFGDFQPTIITSDCSETIEGLTYLDNFISREEEKMLLTYIDSGAWLADLKRRVQHFGYKYDYRARKIETRMKVGTLPEWLGSLAVRLYREGFFEEIPDQVIANEYEPGQGISPHIDCEPCFAKAVASISLGSPVIMEFSKLGEKIPVLLKRRSLVLLAGEARYQWTHCIPPRKKDVFQDQVIHRERRVSLTFRKVVL